MPDIAKIFEQIALKNGVSVEEVRKEISAAIHIGMNSADERARELWSRCPKNGDVPTPEEALMYLVGQIKSSPRSS